MKFKQAQSEAHTLQGPLAVANLPTLECSQDLGSEISNGHVQSVIDGKIVFLQHNGEERKGRKLLFVFFFFSL